MTQGLGEKFIILKIEAVLSNFVFLAHAECVLHCYKTDGEIPVHTHDDARRQRSTTGKYFPYGSGINTCRAPAVFNTSGIFPRYAAWKKGKAPEQARIEPTILGTTRRCLSSDPLLPYILWKINNWVFWKSFLELILRPVHWYIICACHRKNQTFFLSFFLFLSFFFFLSSFPLITTVND